MVYIQISASSALPDISASPPFKAVVIVDEGVTADRRSAVGHWLVEAGCLYMMAWGTECSAWQDAVVLANREAFEFGEIPDDRLIITTCHENEAPVDVFWFAKHSAMHPCARLDDVVLVHVSRDARERELTDEYLGA